MERFYFMRLLLGLLVWNLYITSSGNVQIINDYHGKTYCYGGTIGVAICKYQTQISIVELSYERNCTRCKCTVNEDQQKTCEKFKPSDSWGSYYFYNTISGKMSSYVFVQRKLCGSSIYSNIVHLNYSCVDNDNIMQFGDSNKAGDIVYIQYAGGKYAQKDCSCTASTTSPHPLEVYAVDVRFQKYGATTGNCDLGQKSYLYLSDNNQSSTFRCENKAILGTYDTIFSSTDSTITIQLHLDGDPQFVWVAVSAGGKGLVNVICDDVTLINPPSTTIEATSGAISSQTTDIFATTEVINENSSNKTSEVTTQVIETTNNGNPITTPVIL